MKKILACGWVQWLIWNLMFVFGILIGSGATALWIPGLLWFGLNVLWGVGMSKGWLNGLQ